MNYSASILYFPKFISQASQLFAYFEKPEDIWNAELSELVRSGVREEVAHEFTVWREKVSIELITENLVKEEIKTVSIKEPEYPELLRQMTDSPPVLFYRGVLPKFDYSVSVVGTRRCTAYGRLITNKLAGELASSGIVVVSGLALGIDAEAHSAVLENRGITVAVLGGGIDKRSVSPRENFALSEKILQKGGALISEYPPGFVPQKFTFPARNRIVAGLTLGTLITEAPTSSGALITARYCLDYNRDVFAVPHPLNSKQGEGCNLFIKKGAQLVTSAQDILESLQIGMVRTNEKHTPNPESPTEESIFSFLRDEPKHVNEIIKATGLPSNIITGSLTILELKGKVRNLGGMMYVTR